MPAGPVNVRLLADGHTGPDGPVIEAVGDGFTVSTTSSWAEQLCGLVATVKRSKRFDVPADELWSRIGDFHALHTWHPGIAASDRLQGGSVRRLTTADGGTTVETLLEQGTRSYTYRLQAVKRDGSLAWYGGTHVRLRR